MKKFITILVLFAVIVVALAVLSTQLPATIIALKEPIGAYFDGRESVTLADGNRRIMEANAYILRSDARTDNFSQIVLSLLALGAFATLGVIALLMIVRRYNAPCELDYRLPVPHALFRHAPQVRIIPNRYTIAYPVVAEPEVVDVHVA
jgi:hypothetical protein